MVDIDYTALTNSIVDAIPADVFLWMKFSMIAIVIFFIFLIIKNIMQIGTSSRIRKILKVVKDTNKKLDSVIESSVVTMEEQQADEYSYQ